MSRMVRASVILGFVWTGCASETPRADSALVEVSPKPGETAERPPVARNEPPPGKLVGFHLPQPAGPKLGDACADNPELRWACGADGHIAIEQQHQMGGPIQRPCALRAIPLPEGTQPYSMANVSTICVEGSRMFVVEQCMVCRIPGETLALVDLEHLNAEQHAQLRARLGLPGADPTRGTPPPGPASASEWRSYAAGLKELPGAPGLMALPE